MADESLHYTPIPQETTAKSASTTGGIKSMLPYIVIAALILIAAILGIVYYSNVASVKPKPSAQNATSTPATPTTTKQASPENNIDSQSMSTEGLSCGDSSKYIARLQQIHAMCEPGCCPWTDSPNGCRAPRDPGKDGTIYCKPKGDPCSDGTCWECRFTDGLRMIRYQNNQWVSCSAAPTPTPTIAPIEKCSSPQQCLKPEDCETPPSATNPGAQCTNGLYCCKPKMKITVTMTPPVPSPSPTPAACVKPTLNIEVQCLQCSGEASTQ